MSALQDAREVLAGKLNDAGLTAVLDPAGMVAPCVLVALPFIEKFRNLGDCVNVTAEFRVLVFAPSPGNAANAERLLADVVTALVALSKDVPSEATPTEYPTGATSPPLPAYEFTVTKHVHISTEGV